MGRTYASIAAPAYLVLCVLLGGATMAGYLAHAMLQAFAVGLILVSLWTMRGSALSPEARPLVWIVALYVVVNLLMLVPLPPDLWRSLPGRETYAKGMDLLGVAPSWQPMSLDTNGTIASLLSILPPVAMFLLVAQMPDDSRRGLPWFLIGLALASVVLGAFQLLGGTESRLRFYEVTNTTLPVGFFSNANHLATLALCSLPFTGYLAARAASRGSSRAKRSSAMMVAVGIGIFLCVGIAAIGSLAGYALFPIAALASALIFRRAAHGPLTRRWAAGLGALFAIFLALSTAGPISGEALARKESSGTSRKDFAERTLQAIGDHAPAGTGLGTFQNIYRLYDDPTRTDRAFVNHAHNDYLEAALELGIPGLLLILGFFYWWGRRTLAVWRGNFRGADLARAGSVAIAVVILHSVVDYPIRTAAISAVFAMACALLVPYTGRSGRRDDSDEEPAGGGLRHLQAD